MNKLAVLCNEYARQCPNFCGCFWVFMNVVALSVCMFISFLSHMIWQKGSACLGCVLIYVFTYLCVYILTHDACVCVCVYVFDKVFCELMLAAMATFVFGWEAINWCIEKKILYKDYVSKYFSSLFKIQKMWSKGDRWWLSDKHGQKDREMWAVLHAWRTHVCMYLWTDTWSKKDRTIISAFLLISWS